MKKLFSLAIALFLFAGCANAGASHAPPKIGVDIEKNCFTVSPQEFITGFNDLLEDFQSKSDDQKAQFIIPLPDFAESDKSMDIDRGFSITYSTNDDGNLSKIKITAIGIALSNEASLTFGFLSSALPAYINPGTDFSFNSFDLNADFDFDGSIDGDVEYQFFTTNGAVQIEIQPVQLKKHSSSQ